MAIGAKYFGPLCRLDRPAVCRFLQMDCQKDGKLIGCWCEKNGNLINRK